MTQSPDRAPPAVHRVKREELIALVEWHFTTGDSPENLRQQLGNCLGREFDGRYDLVGAEARAGLSYPDLFHEPPAQAEVMDLLAKYLDRESYRDDADWNNEVGWIASHIWEERKIEYEQRLPIGLENVRLDI